MINISKWLPAQCQLNKGQHHVTWLPGLRSHDWVAGEWRSPCRKLWAKRRGSWGPVGEAGSPVNQQSVWWQTFNHHMGKAGHRLHLHCDSGISNHTFMRSSIQKRHTGCEARHQPGATMLGPAHSWVTRNPPLSFISFFLMYLASSLLFKINGFFLF